MSMTEDSVFEFPEDPVTSPDLPADSGIVHTPKEFSDALTLDLPDEEIQKAMMIIMQTSRKWRARFAVKMMTGFKDVDEAMHLVDQFEDEIKTRLAEMDLVASVDVSPLLDGQPVAVDLIGALPSHYSAKYGMDHEKKAWEVKKANALGQPFLGADRLE